MKNIPWKQSCIKDDFNSSLWQVQNRSNLQVPQSITLNKKLLLHVYHLLTVYLGCRSNLHPRTAVRTAPQIGPGTLALASHCIYEWKHCNHLWPGGCPIAPSIRSYIKKCSRTLWQLTWTQTTIRRVLFFFAWKQKEKKGRKICTLRSPQRLPTMLQQAMLMANA